MNAIVRVLTILVLLSAGCEGIQRASLVGTGTVNKNGRTEPIYVVSAYHNNFMGYSKRTAHEVLPDLNNMKEVRQAIDAAEPYQEVDGPLGKAVDAVQTYLTKSLGTEMRCVVLSLEPPVFGYYRRNTASPTEPPDLRPFVKDAMLEQKLDGYVVAESRIFATPPKAADPDAVTRFIVRQVQFPDARAAGEVLRTEKW